MLSTPLCQLVFWQSAPGEFFWKFWKLLESFVDQFWVITEWLEIWCEALSFMVRLYTAQRDKIGRSTRKGTTTYRISRLPKKMVQITLLDCCDVVFLAIMEKTRSGHPNRNTCYGCPFCDERECFDFHLKIRLFVSTEQVCERFWQFQTWVLIDFTLDIFENG